MSRKFLQFKNTKGTVFGKTFLSLMLISLIPCLLIGCLSYFIVSKEVTKEIEKSNVATVKQIKESCDNIISNISSISYQVIFNSDVINASNYTNISGVSEFAYKNIIGFLSSLKSTNEIISDIIIGFDGSKNIVTQDGKYDADVYYKSIYKIADIYRLNNEIKNTTKLQFRYIGNFKVDYAGGVSEKLMFLQSISYDASDYNGYILITVDKKELAKNLKQYFKNFNCYITDQENEILSINEYEIEKSIISIINEIDENSVLIRNIANKKYAVIKTASPVLKFNYAVVTPYENVIHPMIFIKWTTIFICILVFLICLVASYLIGIRLHKPIKNMTDYIKLIYHNKLEDKNEYSIMNQFFNHIFQENVHIKETLKQSQSLVRQSAIKEILDGRINEGLNFYELGLNVEYKNYQAVVFDITNAADYKDEFFKGIFLDIEKLTERYLNQSSAIYAITKSNRYIIFLIGENDEETRLNDFGAEVTSYLKGNDIEFYASAGRIYEGIINAKASYIDALYALKNIAVEQVNTIVHFDEIELIQSNKLEISSEEQEHILTLVQDGNYNEIQNVIKAATLKSANKKHIKIYEQVAHYIEENYQNDISLQEVADFTGVSLSYVSWIFKEISNKNFLDYLNSYRILKAKELLVKTDLTVEKIAEQVGIYSGNTLIRIFKKYEGMTPGQYRTKRKE